MASIKTSFKVEGLKELQATLLELPKATQGNVLKKAAVAPAADFADEAGRLAPREKGKLQIEIKVSRPKILTPGKAAFAAEMASGGTRAEAAAAARAANRAAGGTGKSVLVMAGPTKAAFYGLFQEFGTAHHAAQPFMRPAWDRLSPGMIGQFAAVLGEEIEKARKRLAKKAERLAAKMKT